MVIINPGSGPIDDESTFENARKNIEVFIRDLHLDNVQWGHDPKDPHDDGRFRFTLSRGADGRLHFTPVDMPGIPLKRVRYVGDMDQNIWDFPRLYVDDSSWVWKFAVGIARHKLQHHPEDDE